MEINKVLHREIMSIVDNQMRDNDPAETKQTFKRLVKAGYSETDAKKYIGQCVAIELFNIMKHQQPFNEKICSKSFEFAKRTVRLIKFLQRKNRSASDYEAIQFYNLSQRKK